MQESNHESPIRLTERQQATIDRWIESNAVLKNELEVLFNTSDRETFISLIASLNEKYLPNGSQIEGMYTDIDTYLPNGIHLRIRKDDEGRMDFEMRQ